MAQPTTKPRMDAVGGMNVTTVPIASYDKQGTLLADAIMHLRRVLNATASQNGNGSPLTSMCVACERTNTHGPGLSVCPCPCHPARAFLSDPQ